MTRPRPSSAPPPTHSDAARRTITSELVRLTIGGRGPERPELVDVAWRGLQAYRAYDAATRFGVELDEWQKALVGRLLLTLPQRHGKSAALERFAQPHPSETDKDEAP